MRVHRPLLALLTLIWPMTAMADAPHDIPTNMRLWLDGLDVSGTDIGNGGGANPTGGAQVTTWKDKSANAYTAGDATSYGATTHSLPTYSAGNGVSFDGTTNVLEVVGGIYPNNAAISDSDYFIVTTSATNKYQFLFYNNLPTSSSGPRISAHIPWSDGTIYWDHSTRIAISWGGNSSVYNRKYIYNLGASASGQQSIARDGNTFSSINGSSATTYTKLSTHTFF